MADSRTPLLLYLLLNGRLGGFYHLAVVPRAAVNTRVQLSLQNTLTLFPLDTPFPLDFPCMAGSRGSLFYSVLLRDLHAALHNGYVKLFLTIACIACFSTHDW